MSMKGPRETAIGHVPHRTHVDRVGRGERSGAASSTEAAAASAGAARPHVDEARADAFDARAGTAAPTHVDGAGGGRPLGPLGIHGMRRAEALRTGENPLGALASLSAVEISAAAAQVLDAVKLDVKVPLRPGVHAIPVGDKRVLVEVPRGTVLAIAATAAPGPGGLVVQGADLAFSKSVRVQNPADLSFAGGGALGDLANAMVEVKLDGVAVAAGGAVTPRGTLSRPSANLFKHVFSTGRSEHALESLVGVVGRPRVRTSVAALAKGDVLQERPALAAADLPLRFDLGALLEDVGAMTEGGTFTLRLEGRSGFLDVGRGRATVIGADRALSATVTGDFRMAEGGAVEVRAEARSKTSVPVRVGFDAEGAPEASAGQLSVSAREGRIDVAVGGAALAAVRALAGRLHVAIPDGVSLQVEGDALVSTEARVRLQDGGLVVERGELRAVIDARGTKATADAFELSLGEGSTLELAARDVRTEGGDLVVESVEGAFTIASSGLARRGVLKAAIEEAGSSGAFSLRLDDGVRGEATARYLVRARPKVLGVPLPRGGVEGEARVVFGRDAVTLEDAARFKLGS